MPVCALRFFLMPRIVHKKVAAIDGRGAAGVDSDRGLFLWFLFGQNFMRQVSCVYRLFFPGGLGL